MSTIKKKVIVLDVTMNCETDDTNMENLNKVIGAVEALDRKEVRVGSSRDLELLEGDFKATIKGVYARCNERRHPMRPFFTIRDIWTQAQLWRQSRPIHEIEKACKKLRQEGADFLARVVEEVGPQQGRWATNALPGQSWHQWGLAVDSYALGQNGRAVWSASFESYKVYADIAQEFGLMSGYYWKRQDAVHVQKPADGVRQTKTWAEIDAAMREKFLE